MALAVVVAFCVPLVVEVLPADPKAFRFSTDEGLWFDLRPGQELCQRSIDVPVGFSRVVATDHRGPLAVEVRGAGTAGGRVDVCLTPAGTVPTRLRAANAEAMPRSEAFVDGRPAPVDVRLDFLRAEPANMLSRLTEIGPRLALFKPGWLGEGVVLALALLVALGVPGLIGAAV